MCIAAYLEKYHYFKTTKSTKIYKKASYDFGHFFCYSGQLWLRNSNKNLKCLNKYVVEDVIVLRC